MDRKDDIELADRSGSSSSRSINDYEPRFRSSPRTARRSVTSSSTQYKDDSSSLPLGSSYILNNAGSVRESRSRHDPTPPLRHRRRSDASLPSQQRQRNSPRGVKSWPTRFWAFLDGPVAGPAPLPAMTPGMTAQLSLPNGSHSFQPDAFLVRVYTSRLRQWSMRRPYLKGLVLLLFFSVWIIGMAFFVRANSFLSSTTPSLGDSVETLGCTSTFWNAQSTSCGLDGQDCLQAGSFTFRCPASCASQLLYAPRSVGAVQAYFVPLVVGGGEGAASPIYRADSFICAAAVHASQISDRTGGCGILNVFSASSNITSYPSSLSNGIQSIDFPTSFPLAFDFSSCENHYCRDLRWEVLGFNVGMMTFLMLVLDPEPIILFWTMVSVAYWHVFLVSDPQSYPPVMSDGFAGFLPALFISFFFWRVAFQWALPTFSNAPLERIIWYLGGLWPGILLNVVSVGIPIDTLTSGSFGGSGAAGWVAALLVVLLVVIFNQIALFWKTGFLKYYLKWTIICALVIIILSQLPGLVFRLHHYVFGIMFMPALCFATRVSALFQALLLGLFSNGVAKFGLDSILQTKEEISQGGALGTDLPSFLINSTNFAQLTGAAFLNSSVFWNPLLSNVSTAWDGFSLIVDDVERYRGTSTNFSLSALSASLPHFFRLAYQRSGDSGDYTKAASWYPNGTWVDPLPGPA